MRQQVFSIPVAAACTVFGMTISINQFSQLPNLDRMIFNNYPDRLEVMATCAEAKWSHAYELFQQV